MATYITFFFHHGGKFVKDNKVKKYMDSKVDSMPPMDVDHVNYFDLVALFKNLGYHDMKAMWWMHPGRSDFNTGLRPCEGDYDINRMCDVALEDGGLKSCSMHLYFEHPVLGVEDAVFVDPEEVLENIQTNAAVKDLLSYDDYNNAEDSIYRPPPITDSNSEEDLPSPNSDGEEDYGKKQKAKAKKKNKVEEDSGNEDSIQASFEATGYASHSEQMRTLESTDDEGRSRPTFPVFNPETPFGQSYSPPFLAPCSLSFLP